MKNILTHAGLTIVCLFFSFIINGQTNTTGYYPMKIKNSAASSSSVSAVYFIMTAQMWDSTATNVVLRFTWSADSSGYIGHLDTITENTSSSAYSYRIDTLQGYNTADSSILLYIPHLQSGRCMVSLNYKMTMTPVLGAGAYSLAEPNINSTVDPNTGILFDKFEFSYDTTGTQGTFYIDPTAVDFFAIPITLTLNGNSSGAPLGARRDSLMNTMRATLKKYDQTSNSIWGSLAMYDVTKTTVLRLAAPYLAPGFDTTYLTNAATYGISYKKALMNHYLSTGDSIGINCDELFESGEEVYDIYKQLPAQDPGAYIFYGKMSNVGNDTVWSFTNNPTTGNAVTRTVNMSEANSYDFFAPGVAPFDTPDETIKSIIVRQITAAFTVGLLPAPNATMLDSAYLNAPSSNPYYSLNSRLPGATASNGPWYNLYTRAVHSAIPQLYAFAFDDELGQSGTLTSTVPSDTVTVTIGNMGSTVIPPNSFQQPPMPAINVSWTGFTQSGQFWTTTATWSAPEGQVANATYYWMLTDANFVVPADTLIAFQLAHPNNAPGQGTTINLPLTYFGSNSPSSSTKLQVIVCGGNVSCPTSSSVFIPNGPGTAPVSPTPSASKTRKPKK
jgi:hypothetical protein